MIRWREAPFCTKNLDMCLMCLLKRKHHKKKTQNKEYVRNCHGPRYQHAMHACYLGMSISKSSHSRHFQAMLHQEIAQGDVLMKVATSIWPKPRTLAWFFSTWSIHQNMIKNDQKCIFIPKKCAQLVGFDETLAQSFPRL